MTTNSYGNIQKESIPNERSAKLMLRLTAVWLLLLTGCENHNAPQPPAQAPADAQFAAFEDPQAGKALAAGCESCHGKDGINGKPGVPFIAGQYPEYLSQSMHDYKSDQRHHDAMHASVQTFSEQDIKNVSIYFAHLPANWTQSQISSVDFEKPKQRDISIGAQKAQPCESCHGESGNSEKAIVPSLSILQPEYFRKALNDYISGKRRDAFMNNFKHVLDQNDIEQLSAYFSHTTPRKSPLSSGGDIKKIKSLAISQCAGCHGLDGNSGNPLMPSIAGQPQDYLVKAINDYKNGARKDKFMQPAVKKLSASQINSLAAYYTAQAPQKGTAPKTTVSGFDPISEGAMMAGSCNGCHGEHGNSISSGTPRISALQRDYFISAVNTYRSGARKHDLMQMLVGSLNEVDMEKLALYYSAQSPVLRTKLPGKIDYKQVKPFIPGCNGCHGNNGNSTQQDVPGIAGQDYRYLLSALNAYKNKTREHESMNDAVAELSEQSIKDIAAYYSHQEALSLEISQPRAPEVIAAQCDRCHVGNGNGHDPKVPKINAQLNSYLEKAISDYKNDDRDNSAMHAMTVDLTLVEIKAVAALYSQRTPIQ